MFIMDASQELDLKNPAYKKVVELYVWQAYLNDLGEGDITTELFVSSKNRLIKAEIIAKESGILAGIHEAEWFLKKVSVRIILKKKDGFKFKKGDCVMKIQGRADKILAAERTLLNLLQRMSGISTATNRLVEKAPKSVRVLATRKTFWGDLDKRAVSVGGGYTHRLNLGDAVLIKENHIALIDDMEKFYKGFGKAKNIRFIEVEFENLKQAEVFAGLFKRSCKTQNVAVMLDNFSSDNVKKSVRVLSKTNVLIEVSGGINEKNIKKYAIKGVSAISSGSITNKAPAIDFSLNILK